MEVLPCTTRRHRGPKPDRHRNAIPAAKGTLSLKAARLHHRQDMSFKCVVLSRSPYLRNLPSCDLWYDNEASVIRETSALRYATCSQNVRTPHVLLRSDSCIPANSSTSIVHPPSLDGRLVRKPASSGEMFWLCAECAAEHTLVIDIEHHVHVVPLRRVPREQPKSLPTQDTVAVAV